MASGVPIQRFREPIQGEWAVRRCDVRQLVDAKVFGDAFEYHKPNRLVVAAVSGVGAGTSSPSVSSLPSER